MTGQFDLDGEVELFPGEGGWHYVRIPPELTDGLSGRGRYGMIPVGVQLGSSRWQTSLMPMGDGFYFVALNKRVRSAEDIRLGDDVHLTVEPR